MPKLTTDRAKKLVEAQGAENAKHVCAYLESFPEKDQDIILAGCKASPARAADFAREATAAYEKQKADAAAVAAITGNAVEAPSPAPEPEPTA